MRKIGCQERDDLHPEEMDVLSSCTDLDGTYHSYPYMETTWGYEDRGIVKDIRHPGIMFWETDRLPCEHYLLEEQ